MTPNQEDRADLQALLSPETGYEARLVIGNRTPLADHDAGLDKGVSADKIFERLKRKSDQ